MTTTLFAINVAQEGTNALPICALAIASIVGGVTIVPKHATRTNGKIDRAPHRGTQRPGLRAEQEKRLITAVFLDTATSP